jgi:ATP-dependent helicase HrpA
VDRGDSVAIRVLDAEAHRARAMHAGLRRLIMLTLAQDLRYLRRNLPGSTACGCNTPRRRSRRPASRSAGPRPAASGQAPTDLADELIALILDLTFTEGQPPIRDQAAFEQRIAERKGG